MTSNILKQKIPQNGIILCDSYNKANKRVIIHENHRINVNYEFLQILCPELLNILSEENGILKLIKRIPIDGLQSLLKNLGYFEVEVRKTNVMCLLIAAFVLHCSEIVDKCINFVVSNVCQEFVTPYLKYLEITSQIYQITDCMDEYLSIYGFNELNGNKSSVIFDYLIQIDNFVIIDKDFIHKKILEYYDYNNSKIDDICEFCRYIKYTDYEQELKTKGIWDRIHNNVLNPVTIPRIVYRINIFQFLFKYLEPLYNSIDKILINMCGVEDKDKYHLSEEDFKVLSNDSSTHNNIISILKLDKEHVDDKIYLLALSFSIELKLIVINNIEKIVFERLKYIYNNILNNISKNHLYFCFILFLQNSYSDKMISLLCDNIIMLFQYPEVIQCDVVNVLQRIIKPSNIHLLNGLITSFNTMKLYPNYVNLLSSFKQIY